MLRSCVCVHACTSFLCVRVYVCVRVGGRTPVALGDGGKGEGEGGGGAVKRRRRQQNVWSGELSTALIGYLPKIFLIGHLLLVTTV